VLLIGTDMTPSTNSDDNRSDNGLPGNTQPASATVGANKAPNDLESRSEVQSAPPATPAARRRNDTLWGTLATAVAVAAMLWIAYQSNVRSEVTQVQKQIAAQHDESVAELQSLKDKIQGITATQSRTDAEVAKLVRQSPPAKSEIQGLQNHVNTLRREPNAQKR
jgi:septal ring factor EnvC (AmiA/AmiB activator)